MSGQITLSSKLSNQQPKPEGKTSPHYIATINGVRCVVWVEEKAIANGEEVKLPHRATNEQYESLVAEVVQPLLQKANIQKITEECTFKFGPEQIELIRGKTTQTLDDQPKPSQSRSFIRNGVISRSSSSSINSDQKIQATFQQFLDNTRHVEEETPAPKPGKKEPAKASVQENDPEDRAAAHTYKSIDQNLRAKNKTLTSETVAHSLAVIQQQHNSKIDLALTEEGSCIETNQLASLKIGTAKDTYIPIRIGAIKSDHFVSLFVGKNKQVQYYDPLGNGLQPELKTPIDQFLKSNFEHPPSVTLIKSDLLQSDAVNCGAFVIREYRRKMDDPISVQPGKITQRDSKSLIEKYRKDLADTILESRNALLSQKKPGNEPNAVPFKPEKASKLHELALASPPLQVADGTDLIRIVEENGYGIKFTDQPLLVCSSRTNLILKDDPYTPLAEIRCRTNLSGYDIDGQVAARISHQKAGLHYTPIREDQREVDILLVPSMPQSIEKIDSSTKEEIENSLYSILLHAKEKKSHLVIALPKVETEGNRDQVIQQLATSCYEMVSIAKFQGQFDKILFVVDGNGQADDRKFMNALQKLNATIYERQ